MEITEEGMNIEDKEEQSEKAFSPISAIDEGIETVAREERPAKAPSPIAVTGKFRYSDGIATSVAESAQFETE
jgi:hypothetical protein